MRVKSNKIEGIPKKKTPFFETWSFIIFICVVVPIIFRSFFFAPFHIPSGSMKSTLLVGDYIFVSKSSYGYSRYSLPFGIKFFEGRTGNTKPKRGDVIVFRPPQMSNIDYIKRLVGLPGDTIQVKKGVLFINGQELPRRKVTDFIDELPDGSVKRISRYIETMPEGLEYYVLDETPNGRLDNTRVYKVPDGHYFFMGDNRDNSADSRVLDRVGYIPEENLVGRAEVIFFSVEDSIWKIWKWLSTMRGERFWHSIQFENE